MQGLDSRSLWHPCLIVMTGAQRELLLVAFKLDRREPEFLPELCHNGAHIILVGEHHIRCHRRRPS